MLFAPKPMQLKDLSIAILRSPNKGDAEAILHFLRTVAEQSPFLIRYPEEFTETAGDQEIRIAEANDSGDSLMLVLFSENEPIAIGTVNPVSRRYKQKHRAVIGMAILEEYTGQRLGTELLTDMIAWAKDVAGYEQIELGVIRDNHRAIRLYQRHGFEVYGRLGNAVTFKDGTYADEYLMVKHLHIASDEGF